MTFSTSFCGAAPLWAVIYPATGAHTLPTETASALFSSSTIGALFPILGFIVAICATQLLRRRKIAQLRSTSSSGES